MDDITLTRPPKPSLAFSATAELTVELAKCLVLVAASSMSATQQEVWLRAAAESLENLLPFDVHEVCLEVRRTVIRASQIVPAIAASVKERDRHRPIETAKVRCACGQGTKAVGRTDVHWAKRDGQTVVEWCEPEKGAS